MHLARTSSEDWAEASHTMEPPHWVDCEAKTTDWVWDSVSTTMPKDSPKQSSHWTPLSTTAVPAKWAAPTGATSEAWTPTDAIEAPSRTTLSSKWNRLRYQRKAAQRLRSVLLSVVRADREEEISALALFVS